MKKFIQMLLRVITTLRNMLIQANNKIDELKEREDTYRYSIIKMSKENEQLNNELKALKENQLCCISDAMKYYSDNTMQEMPDKITLTKEAFERLCGDYEYAMKEYTDMWQKLENYEEELEILYKYIEEQHNKAKRRALLNWCKEVSEYFMYEDDWNYSEDTDSYWYEYADLPYEDFQNMRYENWDYYAQIPIFENSEDYDNYNELKQKHEDCAPWAEFMDDPKFHTYDFDIYEYGLIFCELPPF